MEDILRVYKLWVGVEVLWGRRWGSESYTEAEEGNEKSREDLHNWHWLLVKEWMLFKKAFVQGMTWVREGG